MVVAGDTMKITRESLNDITADSGISPQNVKYFIVIILFLIFLFRQKHVFLPII